jgi:hypothetical protein
MLMYHSSPAVRVAVLVGLQVVEDPAALEIVDDGLGDVGCLQASQPAKAVVVAAVLVDGHDDRQADRFAELEVLGTGAGGDVDDAGPLLLADLGPRHDPVLVARLLERALDLR